MARRWYTLLLALGCGLAAQLGAIAANARGGADSLEVMFSRMSYGPGERATLVVAGDVPAVTVQLFRSGPETVSTRRNGVMNGVPVNDPVTLERKAGRNLVPIDVRHWPSGVYFARVTSRAGPTAFAPFVVRAAVPGQRRVAVVLPTNTWQAYNFRDEDGDGVGDTWYASESVTSVHLRRPYEHRGVPRGFRGYTLGFLRWMARTGKEADFLTDDDLQRLRSPARLASLYDLLVFAGHEEYVTPHAYDLVERYRNRGGNLMFLSSNNFFWRVDRRGDRIFRVAHWRDLGRPEAALIGVQYVDWFQNRYPNAPYRVVGARAAPWLFEGTRLRNGSRFGSFGIEIDARSPASPPGTRVLARIPNLFGPGRSAEMTYYETPAGAKVFAAGAMNFGGAALVPPLPRLLENLWARLSLP